MYSLWWFWPTLSSAAAYIVIVWFIQRMNMHWYFESAVKNFSSTLPFCLHCHVDGGHCHWTICSSIKSHIVYITNWWSLKRNKQTEKNEKKKNKNKRSVKAVRRERSASRKRMAITMDSFISLCHNALFFRGTRRARQIDSESRDVQCTLCVPPHKVRHITQIVWVESSESEMQFRSETISDSMSER